MKLPYRRRLLIASLFVAALVLIRGKAALEFAPIEPEASWKNPVVRVCWASPSFLKHLIDTKKINDVDENIADLMKRAVSNNAAVEATPTEKNSIQAIVTREFNHRNSGIQFVGWKNCEEDAVHSHAYLFTGSDESSAIGIGGQSSIGQCANDKIVYRFPLSFPNGYFRESGEKAGLFIRLHRRNKKAIPLLDANAITALHEFGHLAGLRHEHIRKESKTDPNCTLTGDDWMTEGPDGTTRFVGPYDPNSVMNYCWIHLIRDSHGTQFLLSNTPNQWPAVILGARLHPSQISLRDTSVISGKQVKYQTLSGVLHTARVALSWNDLRSLRCLYFPDPLKPQYCR